MAKNIMIQGTMSNAGKSLIAAALCRIFKEDGYKVAPFKSQNMALNSYITRDGHEMGRAQVVQAQAAGIEPDVRMNPILLKPTTDVGSQVIVNGIPIGNMPAMEYYKNKKRFVPHILSAYESLASEYDIIVLEGAGSPVEINLKREDIVNMGMASMVNAPVLLVGDIDRGGVFAQLYGTVALLEEEERALLKGLIVNKFRGDAQILKPGLKQLEELCGVPVTGVVPYLKVNIDDEDSLTTRFESGGRTKQADVDQMVVDIAVIRLPRISNFTDFSPFEGYEEIALRYVESAEELGKPDLIILPGTKSTLADLAWLRRIGLDAAILRHVRKGGLVFGICGGFQMLGQQISDPLHTEVTEQAADHLPGLGLLDMDTVFLQEKHQTQVAGVLSGIEGVLAGLNGKDYEGYEIHMGRSCRRSFFGTDFEDEKNVLHDTKNSIASNPNSWGETDSPVFGKGTVYGTYIHGIFDAAGIVEEILNVIAQKKGIQLEITQFRDIKDYRESQYNLLADAVRQGLDMEYIYAQIFR